MTEIVATIVIVCVILAVDFVAVIFIEDRRRKRKRQKNKRTEERADSFLSDLISEEDDLDENDYLCEQKLAEEEPWTEQKEFTDDTDESCLKGKELLHKEKNIEEDSLLCRSERDEEKLIGKQNGQDEENNTGKSNDLLKEEKNKEQEALAEEMIPMNSEASIICINDVTMKFRIATGSTSGLKDFMIQKIKKQISTRELIALDHVSFEVMKGEVVGIIGTNGSGKSTLLKIVAGALEPSEGMVVVDKKKVQMLSLGAGFDTELSARENVYLNGAIIGYSKEFINENYDKIVEFSELEGFMDEKVKNFSSGMVSRLAFAIATMGDAAEILILDEVLSVGDEFFRKKSLARVKEMIHGGSTVLMVSHGMSTIIENCTKVVWIEKGKLQMVGDARIVCAAYRNYNNINAE